MNKRIQFSAGTSESLRASKRGAWGVRGFVWLFAALLGVTFLVRGLTSETKPEAQAELSDLVAEHAPETLSEAERLVALYRFVHEDIRQIDARYG